MQWYRENSMLLGVWVRKLIVMRVTSNVEKNIYVHGSVRGENACYLYCKSKKNGCKSMLCVLVKEMGDNGRYLECQARKLHVIWNVREENARSSSVKEEIHIIKRVKIRKKMCYVESEAKKY